MSAGRRLVVLRHGETVHNAAGIWQGQLDSPLSERGAKQAYAVGPALARWCPTRVVSSDLSRAERTGQAVADALGIPLSTDRRLREIHAGHWQGLTNAEIARRWPDDRSAILAGEDRRRGETGESLGEVLLRTRECVLEVAEGMTPGECVVVSTHGAAGKALVGGLLGLDVATTWRLLGGLDNCHVAVLAEGAHGWFVEAWNLDPVVGSGSAGAASDTPH